MAHRESSGAIIARQERAFASPGLSGAAAARATVVRFALGGAPLPSFTNALPIGETVRMAALAATDRAGQGFSTPARLAALTHLSGHDLGPTDPHTSYLAEDSDGDGCIDHVLVHLATGFDGAALAGLKAIRRVWRGPGEEWGVRVVAAGSTGDFPNHPYLATGREWVSVTPYLHPWFRKKGFEVEDQIHRECDLRGWGDPVLERLERIPVGGRQLLPRDFHLRRAKPEVRQPDRRGSFWRLTFPAPVTGPVTLGFARFWGVGVFGCA